MPPVRRSRQVGSPDEQDMDDIDEDQAYEPPQNSHGSKSRVSIMFKSKTLAISPDDRVLVRQDSLPSPTSVAASAQLMQELGNASMTPAARYGDSGLTSRTMVKWILILLLLASLLAWLLPEKEGTGGNPRRSSGPSQQPMLRGH